MVFLTRDAVNNENRLAGRCGFSRTGFVHLIVGVGLVATTAALASAPKKPWNAPASTVHFVNPVKADASSIAKGARLYTANCFACHGKTGKGDGPAGRALTPHPGDLSDPLNWEQPDGALFWKISRGRSPMPSFKSMPAQDRWSIVNYIRTLAPKPIIASPRFSAPDRNREALSAVVRAYLDVQAPLAKKNTSDAADQVNAVATAVDSLLQLDAAEVDASAQDVWRRDARDLKTKVDALASSTSDLKALRTAFGDFSQSLIAALKDFGHAQAKPVVVFEAKSRGVTSVWAQSDSTPRTPYGKRAGKPALRERLASQ